MEGFRNKVFGLLDFLILRGSFCVYFGEKGDGRSGVFRVGVFVWRGMCIFWGFEGNRFLDSGFWGLEFFRGGLDLGSESRVFGKVNFA